MVTPSPVVVPTSSWVQPSTIPSTYVEVPISALPSTVTVVIYSDSTIPSAVVSVLPSTIVSTIVVPSTTVVPATVVPSTWTSPV